MLPVLNRSAEGIQIPYPPSTGRHNTILKKVLEVGCDAVGVVLSHHDAKSGDIYQATYHLQGSVFVLIIFKAVLFLGGWWWQCPIQFGVFCHCFPCLSAFRGLLVVAIGVVVTQVQEGKCSNTTLQQLKN